MVRWQLPVPVNEVGREWRREDDHSALKSLYTCRRDLNVIPQSQAHLLYWKWLWKTENDNSVSTEAEVCLALFRPHAMGYHRAVYQ